MRLTHHHEYISIIDGFSYQTMGGQNDGSKRNVIQICGNNALNDINTDYFANDGTLGTGDGQGALAAQRVL